MQDAAHTRIGNEKHRGISGGEKRRVSIGVDIIHGPAVLFLDEPTSGLDSTSAFGVVERLKDIASDGSVVILTIHQPSRRIQQLLDKLIVLAKGKLIYSGSPDALPKHLATFGRSVPDGEDPVEYLLDVIKEYDLSDLGLNPLVQFQKDGIRPPVDQTPKLRAPKYGIRTPTRASQTPQAKKSPLVQLWTPLGRMHGAEDKSATDISVIAVMDGEDEFEDGYDHSLPSSPRFGRTSNVGNKTPIVEIFQTISPFFTADTNRSMWKPGQEKPSWTPVDPRRASAWSTTFAIKNNPNDLKSPAANPLKRDPEIDFSISQTSALSEELVEKDYGPKYANPWLRETAVLMWRNFFNIMRTPELFLVRTVVFVILGTLMSTLFKKFDKSLDGVSKTLNFLSYTLAVFFFSSNDAVPTFIQEKFIFIRETSHYSYRASSYVLANFIVYLPFLATQALAFDLITYLVLHLQTNFVTYWIICSACMITTNSFVMFISSIAPNYIMGYSVVIAFSALFFLTSGFFLKRLDMPPYWIWVHYLSTMKYPYEALLRSEFEHDHHCYAEGVVAVQPGPLGQVKFTDRSPFSNCTVQGVDILHTMDITHEQLNLVSDVAMLLAWGVFYRFLFYFVLRFYCKNQRD
ncbi:hypothetical protein O6H91_19G031900 [Diphasiastrum complanatum]|uniref:Uncharacterized protein n=1 Tax=Diphasiastrum complanatum TaxID=34168 RepID=A0ACC2ATU4_DIPCM|nr:hypothetical protein O6H91_19G031900 [Diphasiastrum complanatum]